MSILGSATAKWARKSVKGSGLCRVSKMLIGGHMSFFSHAWGAAPASASAERKRTSARGFRSVPAGSERTTDNTNGTDGELH
jgi:hypothetical protein